MAPDQSAVKRPSGFLWLSVLLTFIWFAANSSFAVSVLATGAIISVVLAYMFTRRPGVWRDVRLSPGRLYHFVLYTCIFLVELVRANINMMRYVYAPRIKINPGIVRIRTRLETPVGRLALASSVALTPEQLVINTDADSLFIHWLDVKTTDPEKATLPTVAP